jgi:hypothetical protein
MKLTFLGNTTKRVEAYRPYRGIRSADCGIKTRVAEQRKDLGTGWNFIRSCEQQNG